MFNLIVDIIFRPISGIEECIKKAKVLDFILISSIIISANIIALKPPLKDIAFYFMGGFSVYLLFYGTLISSGAMYLGKRMNLKVNYAYPYVLFPFSMLAAIYLNLFYGNKQYLLLIFVFSWEIFLEFLYTKKTFKVNDKYVNGINALLIVLYSYIMRITIIAFFVLSMKLYWLG